VNPGKQEGGGGENNQIIGEFSFRGILQPTTVLSHSHRRLLTWPLHDIAMTNSVWYTLQWREVGGLTIILSNSVGDDGGGGD